MTDWLLSGKPFAVQTQAIAKAFNKRGWGHFLEQGLGKTSVALAEFMHYLKEDAIDVAVIVAPPTLLLNWQKEAREFGVPYEVVVWDSKKKDPIAARVAALVRLRKPFLFAINYESVIASGGDVVETIVEARRTMLIVDESISVKNPTSARSKKLRAIAPDCAMVRILSGAPVTQGVQDLWAQLRLLGALDKMNYYAYRNHFCQMGGYMGKQIIGPREDTAGQLTETLARWSWRAEKKDWTDIPEKLFTQRWCKLEKKQQVAYDRMMSDFMLMMQGDEEVTADMVLTQMAKLQQITSGFVYDDAGKVHWLVEDDENPKLQALLAFLEETGNKTLIFAYHKPTVEMLRRALPESRTAFMIGQMLPSEFESEKARFNEDSNVDYGVCQINAAMYGHTLLGTADRPCHTSVFFENVYSLNARTQSEDRNHRHGQKNNVLYADIIASNMDELAIAALVHKRNIADTVMDALKRR